MRERHPRRGQADQPGMTIDGDAIDYLYVIAALLGPER